MKITQVKRSEEPDPNDRLHRVADRMLERFTLDAESGGMHAIVFLTIDHSDNTSRAVTALSGYEPETADTDAITDLMAHLGAMFQANGMEIVFVPMDKPPGGQG